MNNLPKIGDTLYIPSQLHVYRGEDDIHGGLATISEVIISDTLPIEHCNSIMVKFKEIPQNTSYNYKYLLELQEELESIFKGSYCYPDPDYGEEFNCPNEGWKRIK